mmetsp:Transcript_89717/g.168959  ORF Transcript_89717/g.168959 Transcript_89717/m.168959 type:complete len:719 (-) Transcript_89717:41-2197(-)
MLILLIVLGLLPRQNVVHAAQPGPYLWFDPEDPTRFNCNSSTCAMHDQWTQLDSDTDASKYICSDAQAVALQNFGYEGPRQCKLHSNENIRWNDCRMHYCDAIENILLSITQTDGDGYYGDEECEAFLHFNRTICGAHYRDAIAFCDCICPALEYLVATTECEIEIVAYLLLGRRSIALAKKHYISNFCSIALCAWLERIGNPTLEGAPGHCHQLEIPFHRGQCGDLMKTTIYNPPYRPCPWDVATETDWVMRCSDGYECDVRQESWACCQRHNNRLNCPRNFPVMCYDPLECTGESDHCCAERLDLCKYKRARGCSPLTSTYLPEWHGLVTPAVYATYVPPTTTADPESFIVKPPEDTSSWGEKVSPYLPFILIPIGGLGCLCLVCAALKLASGHVKLVAKQLIGAPRLLAVYKTDIVHIHRPVPKEATYDPMPPRPDYAAIEKARLDAAASEGLATAVATAYKVGKCHLVLVGFAGGPGPVREAAALREAVDWVRSRGLDLKGENPSLINRAEHWLQVLESEKMLVATMEDVAPDLKIPFRPTYHHPQLLSTAIGKNADASARKQAWTNIEDLCQVMRSAKAGGASDGLLREAGEMLEMLIAKTPELPGDRCVLDPDGQGVKILPKGKHRAMWVHTGDMYMYDAESGKAGKMEDEVAHREEMADDNLLGDVDVDPCRPVCAEYAKSATCRYAQRCPWRHCMPKAGDSIRECIFFDD